MDWADVALVAFGAVLGGGFAVLATWLTNCQARILANEADSRQSEREAADRVREVRRETLATDRAAMFALLDWLEAIAAGETEAARATRAEVGRGEYGDLKLIGSIEAIQDYLDLVQRLFEAARAGELAQDALVLVIEGRKRLDWHFDRALERIARDEALEEAPAALHAKFDNYIALTDALHRSRFGADHGDRGERSNTPATR